MPFRAWGSGFETGSKKGPVTACVVSEVYGVRLLGRVGRVQWVAVRGAVARLGRSSDQHVAIPSAAAGVAILGALLAYVWVASGRDEGRRPPQLSVAPGGRVGRLSSGALGQERWRRGTLGGWGRSPRTGGRAGP